MESTQLLLEDISGLVHFGVQQAGKKLAVDREKGIIKGIKIIGFNSQNGRRYLPEALKEAVPLYEGIKVNIDHPEKGPQQMRSTHDRFGKFVNVRFVEGEGIYGDLLYLKNHPLAESVCEAAEREEMNDVFGMSHNAQGEGVVDKKNIFVVSKITEVRHVDLVADPATTKSLTESQSPGEQETEEAAGSRVRYKSKRQAVGAKRKFVKSKSKSANKPTGTLKENDDSIDDEVPVHKSEKKMKDLHGKVMDIIVKHDMADDKKADSIIDLISKQVGGKEMSASESIEEKKLDTPVEEAKDQEKDSPKPSMKDEDEIKEGNAVCEKCGSSYSKMEAKKAEDEDEEDEDEEHEDEEQDKEMIDKAKKKGMKESADPQEQLKYYKTKDAIRNLCEASGLAFEEELVDDLADLSPASLERQIKRLAAAGSAAKPKCSPTQATFQESKSGGKLPEGESLFRWLSN